MLSIEVIASARLRVIGVAINNLLLLYKFSLELPIGLLLILRKVIRKSSIVIKLS